MKSLGIICCAFFVILRLNGQGYIVPNGVVTNLFPGEIDVWNPGTQVNGFSFTPSGQSSFVFDEPATIGVRVFFVSPGDSISLQPILSQNYTELGLQSSYVFNAGMPFYVGLYTGGSVAPPYPPSPPYIYTDPVFGWAELENVNGAIRLLDGAAEYQGGGIFAGTQTIIPAPEPSTFALVALGAISLFALRRSNKKCQAR